VKQLDQNAFCIGGRGVDKKPRLQDEKDIVRWIHIFFSSKRIKTRIGFENSSI